MRYNAFNVDEIGSSHIEKGLPKQDSSDSASGVTENNIPYAIAIVADGHGGSQYFRSDKGSKLAVEVCKEIVLELIEKNIDAKKNEHKIKRKIKINWDKKVTEHFEKEGKRFNSTELEYFRNEIEQTDNSTKKIKLNEYLKKYESADKITPVTIKAYGSTLIAVAAWNDIVMGIHIGDGTCVALYEDGTMNQPIPEDKNNVANIAGSLCNEEPNCRVYFFEKMPIAVFVASDGLDDSFGYGESLYQFYRKLCMNFIDDGPDYRNTLQKKLSEISARGSHDDMSIAGIYNYELLCNYRNVLEAVIELGENKVRLARCHEKYNGLEYQIKAKQNKFENAKRIKSEAENEIRQMRSNKDSIEGEIKNHQDFIIKKIKNSNYGTNSSFIEAKNQFLNLTKKQISGIKEDIKKYTKDLNKMLGYKSKLEYEISQKQKDIDQRTVEEKKLEGDLNVGTRISDLESKRAELEKSIEIKNKEYDRIIEDFNVSKGDFENINLEKASLNNIISDLEKNTLKLQEKVKDVFNEYEKQKNAEKSINESIGNNLYPVENTLGSPKKVESVAEKSESEEKAGVTVSTEYQSDKPINDSALETDMIDMNNVVQNDFEVSGKNFDKNNSEKKESTENISYPENNILESPKKVEITIQKSDSEEITGITVSRENQSEKPINDSDLKIDCKEIKIQENQSDGIETLQDDCLNTSDKTGLSDVESLFNNSGNELSATSKRFEDEKKRVDEIIAEFPFFKEIVERWKNKEHPQKSDNQYWEDFIKLYEFFEGIVKEWPERKEKIEKHPVLLTKVYYAYMISTQDQYKCRNQDLKESIYKGLDVPDDNIRVLENIYFREKEEDRIKTEEVINMIER